MGIRTRHYLLEGGRRLKRIARRIVDGLAYGHDAILDYAGTRQRAIQRRAVAEATCVQSRASRQLQGRSALARYRRAHCRIKWTGPHPHCSLWVKRVCALAASRASHMAMTFKYSFTANGQFDEVDVTVATPATNSTPYGPGYNVTAISGTIGSNAISGEVGTGGQVQYTGNSGGFDNTIFTSSASGAMGSYYGIDGLGIEFTVGSTSYNLYSTGASALHLYSPSARTTANVTLTSTTAPCFTTGTLIRTARGDVAVEHLDIGDLAVTALGENRLIRWIGSRLTHPRRHSRPYEAMPVRVAAHAFGPNRPTRDLLVSPGHSLCVDIVGEVLIPAVALVNGTTITQEDVDSVTYWHVELEGGHDIILAENMPAESYLEMGNRGFFAESDVVDLDASPDAPVATHADFCRPFHAEGALVEVVRAQLAARAENLGWRLEEPGLGDLHLLVDGVRVEPRVRGLAARFTVPAGAQAVWLVSDSSVPAEIAVASPDRRSLGVCIAALTIDDGFGAPRAVALDDPSLCVGFHPVERDGEASLRWTAGRARLPASLWKGLEEDAFLRVDLAAPALPRWVAPEPEAHSMRHAS